MQYILLVNKVNLKNNQYSFVRQVTWWRLRRRRPHRHRQQLDSKVNDRAVTLRVCPGQTTVKLLFYQTLLLQIAIYCIKTDAIESHCHGIVVVAATVRSIIDRAAFVVYTLRCTHFT